MKAQMSEAVSQVREDASTEEIEPTASERKRYPSRGRRYSPAEKQAILTEAQERSVAEAAERFGVRETTIYEWRRRYLIDELNRGACGAMPACELTDIHVALFEAFQVGDIERARALYNRTLPLLLFQLNFRMRMTKEVLQRRGLINYPGLRAPMPELDAQDQRELDVLVAEAESLFTV